MAILKTSFTKNRKIYTKKTGIAEKVEILKKISKSGAGLVLRVFKWAEDKQFNSAYPLFV